jgi:hypothetical protein
VLRNFWQRAPGKVFIQAQAMCVVVCAKSSLPHNGKEA